MIILKSYFLFLINPKQLFDQKLKQKRFYILIQVFFISLVLLFTVNLIFANNEPSTQYSFTPNLNKLNTFSILSLLLLIACFEETLFRLWLNVKKRNIIYSLSLFLSSVTMLVFVISLGVQSKYVFHIYYLSSFLLSIPIFYLSRLTLINRNFEWIKKNFNTLLFLSTWLFSSVHFISYDFQQIDFIDLTKNFITYLIYGYSFGFVRISSGFIYSIVLHALFLFFPFLKYIIA